MIGRPRTERREEKEQKEDRKEQSRQEGILRRRQEGILRRRGERGACVCKCVGGSLLTPCVTTGSSLGKYKHPERSEGETEMRETKRSFQSLRSCSRGCVCVCV